MTIQLKAGFTTEDRRLDRIPQYDERSRAFPIRALVADLPRRSYSWNGWAELDQGNEGACTGFSVAMEAAARPVKVPDITNALAREVYLRAKQLDPWPGEDYEGSSVLAAVKAGQERGWFPEYRWAFGEDDLARAVGYKGPAVIGSWWWSGMFRATDGFLKPTGQRMGGHAYVVTRYKKGKGYYVPNSWGGEGSGWISETDMAALLDDDGEAVIPVKRGGR